MGLLSPKKKKSKELEEMITLHISFLSYKNYSHFNDQHALQVPPKIAK